MFRTDVVQNECRVNMHVVNHNPEGCLELEARVQMGILFILLSLPKGCGGRQKC